MDKSAAILIVDDYLLIRSSVRGVLSELGFNNVFQAENGKSAQDLMRKQKIDIVIGDWSMPVMSGLELLEWMRADERMARVPFMMLTAEANPASVRTALQAGVNAYMIKPFTVQSFASKFMTMIGPVGDAPRSSRIATAEQLARATRSQFVAGSAAPRMAMPEPPPVRSQLLPAAPVMDANVIGLMPPMAERLKKCTVLIVDDIATNIEVLAGALKDEYAIKVAINGKKAIEIANAFHIDLILLDIMMPVMDGFEVCQRLKDNPHTAHIPIIFLSARDGVDDVVSGLKMGAVDYVSKPADPTILKARLSAHLTLATVLADLKRQNGLLVENAHLREDVERMTRHDLKSPIAVALQSSQALLEGELDARQRAAVETIEMASTNALEMINRTLDVYRMEMGQYQPTLEDFNLSALLARVAKQTELAFEERRIKLALPAAGDTRCLGEPLLCYSLFSNLCKNAAEASPDGAQLAIELTPGYGSVHVCVVNEGEVPQAMRAVFFDKYTTAGKPGGTGLGTYSVKLMAEVQGGSVAMQSEAGHTRITVTLPSAGIA
jgi:two-component system, sensor histidine kinase and response regulator